MGDSHRKSSKQVVSELGSSAKDGLTSAEAKKRLEKYGPNELQAGKKINPFKLFIGQFKDVLVIVLIIAAFVSLGVSFLGTGGVTAEGEARLSNISGEYESTAEGFYDVCTESIPTEEGLPEGCDVPLTELGLSSEEVADLRACIGEPYTQVPSKDFCDELYSGISGTSEDHGPTESILIFAIVIAIAVIGFFNEFKAEKTVEALRKLVGHSAKVRRDGKIVEVPANELVPGDIVVLEEGQKVPADMRLIEVKAMQVNEASLTGESVPVSKNTNTLTAASSLGDQKNMLFSGTIVTTGTGLAVITGTGQHTEIGKIATMVTDVEEELTPMQKKLDDLGRKLGVLVLLICVFVFIIIFFIDAEIANDPVFDRLIFAFTVAVALAVAAIPEGLSFVVRISLALGARRMAAKDALVRKLSAVEALGSTDVICSDKTGTLTKGEMTVRSLYTNGKTYGVTGSGYETEGEFSLGDKAVKDTKDLETLLKVGVLCNNSELRDGAVIGDPTEGCLIVSGAKAGLDHEALTTDMKRVDEIPFTSERKRMSTVHRNGHSFFVAAKGAPDILVEHCDRILINGKIQKLTASHKKEIHAANIAMAKDALRVLAFAYREARTQPSGAKSVEKGLVFAGLQGMMDPPREEVKEVMHRVQTEAGMRVLMITGDYVETAKAVAAEIGIRGDAISGSELDEMTQEEFENKVEKISVYARVNPEHKIRIVKALKKHGHQVAMTGDGVNDAPAIKAADIGIAMGINGTDAAKEAADLILLDDQFLTIIDAVEEGRGIFDNVRKFVSYLLGANIAEVLIVVGGIVFLQDPILTATQLLFINIVTDGLPAIALGSDPAEKGIMRYKPNHFQAAIIDKKVWIEMVIYGVIATALLLIEFEAASHVSPVAAVSVAFMGLVIYELVRLVVLRTNYNIPWFSNPWLSVAIVSSIAVTLPLFYIDSLSELFEVEPISGGDWLAIAGGSVLIFVVMKLTRFVLNRIIPEVSPQHSPEHYERV